MLLVVTVVQLLTGVAMKTIHGMFAAKPKPTSLPMELNVQIIAVSIFCTAVICVQFSTCLYDHFERHFLFLAVLASCSSA